MLNPCENMHEITAKCIHCANTVLPCLHAGPEVTVSAFRLMLAVRCQSVKGQVSDVTATDRQSNSPEC